MLSRQGCSGRLGAEIWAMRRPARSETHVGTSSPISWTGVWRQRVVGSRLGRGRCGMQKGGMRWLMRAIWKRRARRGHAVWRVFDSFAFQAFGEISKIMTLGASSHLPDPFFRPHAWFFNGAGAGAVRIRSLPLRAWIVGKPAIEPAARWRTHRVGAMRQPVRGGAEPPASVGIARSSRRSSEATALGKRARDGGGGLTGM